MKKIIIIVMLLFSTNAISDVTGVHYCIMTNWVLVTPEKGAQLYKEEKFTFKIEEDSSSNKDQAAKLIFGEQNKFSGVGTIRGSFIISKSFFQGSDSFNTVSLQPNGDFAFTETVGGNVEVITANCSKF